jgi:hypothetical protein
MGKMLATRGAPGASDVIADALGDLLLAFTAGAGLTPQNRVRLFQLHLKAVEGHHPAVALAALDWLILNNPRNPFPPTPQDVAETCRRVKGTWFARLANYARTGVWETVPSSASLALPLGGPPDSSGDDCLIPGDLARELLALAGFASQTLLADSRGGS